MMFQIPLVDNSRVFLYIPRLPEYVDTCFQLPHSKLDALNTVAIYHVWHSLDPGRFAILLLAKNKNYKFRLSLC